MKIINETKIEEELFFNGCFWVIANSYEDILKGKFSLECDKYLVNYNGDQVTKTSKSSKVHKNIWPLFANKYNNVPFNYYPRGRVNIYNGKVYINLHSKINLPQVIDRIIKEYSLEKFTAEDIEIYDIDQIQEGSHYDFLLQ